MGCEMSPKLGQHKALMSKALLDQGERQNPPRQAPQNRRKGSGGVTPFRWCVTKAISVQLLLSFPSGRGETA